MRRIQSGNVNTPLVAGLVVLLTGVAITLFVFEQLRRNGGGDEPGKDDGSGELMKLTVEAVASAEDAEFGRALGLWRQLVDLEPDNVQFQINEAVTVLKWIDETDSLLNSGQIQDSQELTRLQGELDEAYSNADSVVQKLSGIEDPTGKAKYLQAALLEAKTLKVDFAAADQLRQEAAQLLAEELADNPGQPLLACQFDLLVDRLQTDELKARRTDAMFASWETQPRNLLLLNRAIVCCVETKDSRLLQLLEPSIELTRPLWGVVQRDVNRLKPEELIVKVKEAVEAGDWDNIAIRRDVLRWTNVIRGMKPAYTSDGRLVRPDIMALLDTKVLNQIADTVDADAAPLQEMLGYQVVELGSEATCVRWFDFDLDMDFDLATGDGSKVSLWIQEEGFPNQPSQTVDTKMQVKGMLIADFYASEEPSRPVLPNSVADLMDVDGGEEAAPIQNANRHNTLQEIFCWGPEGVCFLVLQEEGGGLQLSKLESDTGLDELTKVLFATAFDVESDGDLDLVIARDAGLEVYQNNGNRTFTNITEYSDFTNLSGVVEEMRFVDFDNDLDQDLLCISRGAQSITLLENLRHGQFRARTLTDGWPTISEQQAIAIGEFDSNSSWDIAIASPVQTQVVLTRCPAVGQVVPLSDRSIDVSATAFAVGDANNDSYIDLIVGNSNGVEIVLASENGWAEANSVFEGSVTDLRSLDCNGDGALDIAIVADGKAMLLLGKATEKGYLEARVRGINDETKGGRINHFGVGTTLELWLDGRQQRTVVDAPTTHFGLGDVEPDNLRVIFPNGLTQNLENPPRNSLVEEKQELKGSCPFVYGWNGMSFELITDLLWNAPLGLQVARGQVMPDRRWEHLLLPGTMVQKKEGSYELRVTEELWEVAYFDHIQLTAVDHPAGSRVFTNEKVGPPSIAEPQLFLSTNPIYPVVAKDSKGRDVLAQLEKHDADYVQAFDRFVCQGLVEPHFVELDFGDQLIEGIREGKDCRLFLRGWMHPTDTSLNIGIAQNDVRSSPEPPSLWVPDVEGKWVCVLPFMGFPGGKPKSIVVDLNETFKSDDHRIRIGASQQIYWDEAFVEFDTNAPEIKQQILEIESADLHFRGFGKLMPRTTGEPHWYDYNDVSTLPKWPPLSGPFTRFGDVASMLTNDDDVMVVMTSGDEIAIRFTPPEGAVPNDSVRDFVLHSTGWDKDADLNTITGQGSLPLPFKAQSAYPSAIDEQMQVDEVWQKNRDNLTRQESSLDSSTLVN